MSCKVVQGFYDSLRKTFFALRLIGVFPITGLLNGNSNLSRCSWITPYTVYLVLTIISIIGCSILYLCNTLTCSVQYKQHGTVLVHCIASLAVIFIVRLSFNWKSIMNKIDAIEKQLPPFKNGHLVVKTINRAMIYMALFGLVDHAFYLFFTVRITQMCHEAVKKEFTVEKYFDIHFGWVLNIIPYNYATAIWLQIMKTQTTFIFYYIDALIIAASLYLIFRFRNFNRLMRLKVNYCNKNTKWCDVQAHYTRLTRLVKVVDDIVNPFIFLSFFSSLVFICKAIYDFIQYQKKITGNSNNTNCKVPNSAASSAVVHFIITLAFRMFRTLSVSILPTHLHSLSREPLETLHTLPASAYNIQFQRFMDQVYYTKVCLSGLQFFYVTRGTLLSMVSTIITYELVLLQLPLIY